jgi:CRISPR-associated protein Cas1
VSHVVDIVEHGRSLSAETGFLLVRAEGAEIGHVPLDDIQAVIISGRGCSYTNDLVLALTARGAVIVACGRTHLPEAWTLPVTGHHAQARIVAAQAGASRTLNSRLWQSLMRAKLRGQSDTLEACGRERGVVDALVATVAPGDPANVEATAAQRYWPALFGDGFRRARDEPGTNALLNYGYTVVRAAVARAAVASGLHLSLSVRHRRDPLALVDDLIEPFRGAVDRVVFQLVQAGVMDVSREARAALVALLDSPTPDGSLSASIGAFTRWVADAYVTGRVPSWKGGQHVGNRPVRPANGNGRGTKRRREVPEGFTSPRIRDDAAVGLLATTGLGRVEPRVGT